MNTSTLPAELIQRLHAREAELRALLSDTPPADAPHEVSDFKELAEEETQARIEDAQSAHAGHELAMVLAALRRASDGTLGECMDCGEAIAPQRLRAIPWTPYCTACQARREAAAPRG